MGIRKTGGAGARKAAYWLALPLVKFFDLVFFGFILVNLAEALHWIVALTFHLLIRRAGLRVSGLENLPRDRAFVLVSSHSLPMAAEYDIIKFFVNRRVKPWTITAQPAFARLPGLRRFLTFLWRRYHPGAVLVDRAFSQTSLENSALRELERGVVNWVAPEGVRNYGVGLLQGHVGVAKLMARAPQYEFVPMTVNHFEGVNFVGDLFRRHPRLSLKIGKPFVLARELGEITNRDLLQIADEAMRRVAVLTAPERRGYYADSVGRAFEYTAEKAP